MASSPVAAAAAMLKDVRALCECDDCGKKDVPVDEAYELYAGIAESRYRCKACNSTRSRVHYLIKKQPDLDRFMAMPSETRNGFIAKHHKTFGTDLALQIKESVEAWATRKKKIEFAGTGDFLDSPDLAEKYKHKPKKLELIRTNASTFMCPKTGIKHYEDIKYQSVNTATDESGETKKRGAEQDRVAKAAKRVKKEKKEEENADVKQEEDGGLTEKQVANLQRALTTLQKSRDELAAMVNEVKTDGFEEHLPKKIVDDAMIAVAEAKDHAALVALSTSTSKGDFKEMQGEIAKRKTKINDLIKKMRPQLAAAKKETSNAEDGGKDED